MPRFKTSAYHFDDPDAGPAQGTSHPEFRRICKDKFFYDVTDEFAPFGSDAGADTLASLEDWYRGKKPRKVAAFIDEMLEDWEMVLPDLAETREDVIERWLADDTLSMTLPELDGLLIAAAFGQMKITGNVDADVHELALAALAREEFATKYWRKRNPRWEHARAKAAAEKKIRAALVAMR
jgi:uncharacterized protein YfeS